MNKEKNKGLKDPKLLVLDLDGTLLNDEKEIPEINLRVIEKLYNEYDIIPVIATARPLEVAKYIATKAGNKFQGYVIATNGAMIYDFNTDSIISNNSLNKVQVNSLIDISEKYNLEYEFMTEECEVADINYADRRGKDSIYMHMENDGVINLNGVGFNFQENMRKYSNEHDIPLFAISGTKKELEVIQKGLKENNLGVQMTEICDRTDASNPDAELYYFDIMKEGVTKAAAIELIQEQLGIEKQQVIAIGDGGNDIEMFKHAGLSIAMRNANSDVKREANVITYYNNEQGGVGTALLALFNFMKKREVKKEKGIELKAHKKCKPPVIQKGKTKLPKPNEKGER